MGNSDVCKRIEIKIKERGLTKAEFYKGSGITSASFSQWRTGAYAPSKKKLQSAADFLGVTLEYLEYGEEKEKPALPEENELDVELIGRLMQLTPEELKRVDAFVQGILASR